MLAFRIFSQPLEVITQPVLEKHPSLLSPDHTFPSGDSTSTSGSASPTRTGSSKPKTSNSSLLGVIIGVVVGVLAILAVVGFICYKRRGKGKRSSIQSHFGRHPFKGDGQGVNAPFMPLPNAEISPYGSVNAFPHQRLSPLTPPRPDSGVEYYSDNPTQVPPGAQRPASTAYSVVPLSTTYSPPPSQYPLPPIHQGKFSAHNSQPSQAYSTTYPPTSSYHSSGSDPSSNRPPSTNPPSSSSPPPTMYAPSNVGRPTSSSTMATSWSPEPIPQYGMVAAGPPPLTKASYRPVQQPSSGGMSGSSGLSPEALAKVTEAEEEALEAHQHAQKPVLGVTNPDRDSHGDPLGAIAYHASRPARPAVQPQVIQHEDAGLVELPPAYREFSRTPAPPASGP